MVPYRPTVLKMSPAGGGRSPATGTATLVMRRSNVSPESSRLARPGFPSRTTVTVVAPVPSAVSNGASTTSAPRTSSGYEVVNPADSSYSSSTHSSSSMARRMATSAVSSNSEDGGS